MIAACDMLVKSGILPKEITTKEKAAVVALTGRELGLQLMASMRGIYIVNNKPSLSAQMMLALAFNTGELENYTITENGKGEAASCTVVVKRRGKNPYSYTFSVEMIKKMGKYANEWIKQPENMCKQRAISGNLRVTFPDAILGMYTPEEASSIEEAQIIDGPIIGLKSDKNAPTAAPAPVSAAPEEGKVVPEEQKKEEPAPAELQEHVFGFGLYYEIGSVVQEEGAPDYGRFGSEAVKAQRMAVEISKCAEKIGEGKFKELLGGAGYEHPTQINTIQDVAAFLNLLLAEISKK